MDEPLILVTNDDGFDAPGLAALIEAVAPLGRTVVKVLAERLPLVMPPKDGALLKARFREALGT